MRKARRDELAFLPAALEIVETPPSPTGRAIVAHHAVLLSRARLGGFGHGRIVASAPGKIIPSGRTKVVQPFETGVVRAIQSATDKRPGWRRPDRARPDHQRSRTRPSARRSRCRSWMSHDYTRRWRGDEPALRLQSAGRGQPRSVATQRQLLMTRPLNIAPNSTRWKTRSARRRRSATHRGHHREARSVLPVVQERADIRKALMPSDRIEGQLS